MDRRSTGELQQPRGRAAPCPRSVRDLLVPNPGAGPRRGRFRASYPTKAALTAAASDTRHPRTARSAASRLGVPRASACGGRWASAVVDVSRLERGRSRWGRWKRGRMGRRPVLCRPCCWRRSGLCGCGGFRMCWHGVHRRRASAPGVGLCGRWRGRLCWGRWRRFDRGRWRCDDRLEWLGRRRWRELMRPDVHDACAQHGQYE